jgi:hypothetical protein
MCIRDAAFFKRGQERIKIYRVRKKELWVNDAKRILEAYCITTPRRKPSLTTSSS